MANVEMEFSPESIDDIEAASNAAKIKPAQPAGNTWAINCGMISSQPRSTSVSLVRGSTLASRSTFRWPAGSNSPFVSLNGSSVAGSRIAFTATR